AASPNNTGFNAVGTALGTGQTNTGNVSSFANPNFTTQSADVSQALFSGINSSANQQNQLTSAFNKYGSEQNKLDSWTQGVGNVCCFIFLEATNGQLPSYVTACRKYYYEQEP